MSRVTPFILACKNPPVLHDTLKRRGFFLEWERPQERARYEHTRGVSVVVGYDGNLSIYGNDFEQRIIGAALINAGAAA
jgi:hypothetical protein